MPRRTLAALALAAALCALAGWGARGHRTITLLALDGLPQNMPAFLREPVVRARIADQSSEADRWRGTRMHALGHVNAPDHYLDIELLEQFGLTLETVPPLRYDYLRAMAISKHLHPEMVDPYDRAKDADGSKEWPGFVLHAIAEHYAKLRSSFHTYRCLETIADPARAHQLENAKMNVIFHMGMLSHFVGDTAQPLHTTKHFNGWVGDNPHGYTTDRGFHAFIDTGVVELHNIRYDDLRPTMSYDLRVKASDPWQDAIAYIGRSFAHVETLYRMEKDGTLRAQPGKDLIEERFRDGGAMLSALYRAAWEASEPTEQDVYNFVRYSEMEGESGQRPRRRPARRNETPSGEPTPAPAPGAAEPE